MWKKSKKLKKPEARSTDILLAGLAVNDILLAGTVLPLMIYHLSHSGAYFERKYASITLTLLV